MTENFRRRITGVAYPARLAQFPEFADFEDVPWPVLGDCVKGRVDSANKRTCPDRG